MNKTEINQHCKLLSEQLNNMYSDKLFIVNWDSSPWGVSIDLHGFKKLENALIGELQCMKVIVDGAKTKQAACDLAAFWIRGLSDGRDGNLGNI